MSNTWSEVDRYFADLFVPADTALEAALADSAAAGLPAINVAPVQGKLLYLLARSHRIRTVLEIGTLGGYSTIWLARALPDDGRVVTLEIDPKHAAVAQQNFDRAGVSVKIDLRVGSAHDTLPHLQDAGAGPFDLVFIDADKVSTPAYLEWALKMTQPGSLIIVDNVVRNGAVTDAASTDDGVRGVRAALDAMAQHPHLITAAIQTVGQKGYDGLAFALVV